MSPKTDKSAPNKQLASNMCRIILFPLKSLNTAVLATGTSRAQADASPAESWASHTETLPVDDTIGPARAQSTIEVLTNS